MSSMVIVNSRDDDIDYSIINEEMGTLCNVFQKQNFVPTLFIASQQNVKWSDGLCNILNGYGAAIEDADVVTGLEAFMLAAAGKESDLETIYNLLLDHPAAINPYVILPQKQNDHSSELKKRKRSQLVKP